MFKRFFYLHTTTLIQLLTLCLVAGFLYFFYVNFYSIVITQQRSEQTEAPNTPVDSGGANSLQLRTVLNVQQAKKQQAAIDENRDINNPFTTTVETESE